jgi:hypothetical protein
MLEVPLIHLPGDLGLTTAHLPQASSRVPCQSTPFARQSTPSAGKYEPAARGGRSLRALSVRELGGQYRGTTAGGGRRRPPFTRRVSPGFDLSGLHLCRRLPWVRRPRNPLRHPHRRRCTLLLEAGHRECHQRRDHQLGPNGAHREKFGGDSLRNIVNRLTTGGVNGIQIEQSPRARSSHWQDIADAVANVYSPKLG